MSAEIPATAETFHYRLNGGDEHTITVETGLYIFAALAIPAVTGNTRLPLQVEIWCPRLLPEYGPYRYEIYNNEFGNPSIRFVMLVQHPSHRSYPVSWEC